MCALSNMYTTRTRKRPLLSVVIALIALLVSSSVTAQEKLDIIKPTKKTQLINLQHDLFIYTSGIIGDDCVSFAIPNNGLFNMGSKRHSTSTCTSIGLCDFINIDRVKGMNICVGYTRERIAHNISLWGANGVYANWLSADLGISFIFFPLSLSAGFSSDLYLGSRLVNKDNFSYEGLNKKCFNTFSFSSYLAGYLELRKFKFEIRLGFYLKPRIDPNRLAYYSFISSYVGNINAGIRLYYNIFTTGNKLKSPYLFTE